MVNFIFSILFLTYGANAMDRSLQDQFKFSNNYTCSLEYKLGVDATGIEKFPKQKIKKTNDYYNFKLTGMGEQNPSVHGPFFNGLGGNKKVLPLKLTSTKSYGPDIVNWYHVESNYIGIHMIKVLGLLKDKEVEVSIYQFETPQTSLLKLDQLPDSSPPLQTTYWGKCKVVL